MIDKTPWENPVGTVQKCFRCGAVAMDDESRQRQDERKPCYKREYHVWEDTPGPGNKQRAIMDLVDAAWHREDGELKRLGARNEPRFWELYSKCLPWTKKEAVKMVGLVQQKVSLDVYSLSQAAAWLGLTERGLKHHVYNTKRIQVAKPGHDLVFIHRYLVDFKKK